MATYDAKRIADPVHGTIGLNELEAKVITTQVFHRLRNVKQLGLAHYVYPGADYSRLSHSLGACHITGRILEALNRNSGEGFNITEPEIRLYRVAALLHDVGHYPFSHAMEQALNTYYNTFHKDILVQDAGDGKGASKKVFSHERVGKEILARDVELRRVLQGGGVDPDSIQTIFDHKNDSPLARVVSSDLDADRIDYLLRTAHHTGLPYGSIDLDYILSQMRVDKGGRFCITSKAVRTADHFLLCRYFDYQQVAYHKTVAALEWVLKDVISALVESGMLDSSADQVGRMIDTGEWRHFDDAYVVRKMHELADDARTNEAVRLKAQAILERRAPKMVFKLEYLDERRPEEVTDLRQKIMFIEREIPVWADRFGVDRSLWHLWDKAGVVLTNVGAMVPIEALLKKNKEAEEELAQSVHVLDRDGDQSLPIFKLKYSLMSFLSNSALYALRLYVLLPPEKEGLAEEIQGCIKQFWSSP